MTKSADSHPQARYMVQDISRFGLDKFTYSMAFFLKSVQNVLNLIRACETRKPGAAVPQEPGNRRRETDATQ
jgi:hypothetical protein